MSPENQESAAQGCRLGSGLKVRPHGVEERDTDHGRVTGQRGRMTRAKVPLQQLLLHNEKGLTVSHCKPFSYLEAAPGFEPGNKGFAVLCLTTWRCRLVPLKETDI